VPLRLLDGKSAAFRARASFSIEARLEDRSARAVSWRAMRRCSKNPRRRPQDLSATMVAI